MLRKQYNIVKIAESFKYNVFRFTTKFSMKNFCISFTKNNFTTSKHKYQSSINKNCINRFLIDFYAMVEHTIRLIQHQIFKHK